MAQKAFSVGGIGSQPTLDDVVRVALGQQQVVLDPAGAERVKKASPAPKAFQPEAAPDHPAAAPSRDKLTVTQSRAVLMVKLLQLMNGRSGVRLQVAEFLASLLNQAPAGEAALLSASAEDGGVLNQMADWCHSGVGGIEGPKLSAAERAVLRGGGAATAGVAALGVQSAKSLVSLATAAAALSFEALGCQVGDIHQTRQRHKQGTAGPRRSVCMQLIAHVCQCVAGEAAGC